MIYTIIIYLIGYFITFKLWKLSFKSIDCWEWGDVIFGLFVSLFSWITVIVGLLVNLMQGKFGKIKSKPPTWL